MHDGRRVGHDASSSSGKRDQTEHGEDGQRDADGRERNGEHGDAPIRHRVPGSNIARAIEAARRGFVSKESKFKVIVLLTDGEQHEGDPVDAAQEAGEEGIVIHAVGVGTPGGDPIPVHDDDGQVVDDVVKMGTSVLGGLFGKR